VLFFTGCNFNCPYCHNPDLVKNDRLNSFGIEEQAVFDFLEQRQGFLDGVVITGGEPTIQKDLIPLCRKIKRLGYQLKLDTNGSRPQIISQLLDHGLVDYIAMDIKSDPSHYSPLIQKVHNPNLISESIRIIMESCLHHEFRTTCVKPFVDARIVKTIAKLIEGASLFALQQFQNVGVLTPDFFHAGNAGYDEIELLHLLSIAKPWVQNCILRQSRTQPDRIEQNRTDIEPDLTDKKCLNKTGTHLNG